MGKTFITRRQGNSVVITIDKSADVEPGNEYTFEKKDNGQLIYTPVKHLNRWHLKEFTEQYNKEATIEDLGYNPGMTENIGKEGKFDE